MVNQVKGLTIAVVALSVLLVGLRIYNNVSPATAQVNTNAAVFNVHKFGQNTDIDTAAAEDIWEVGGDCEFPAAAATTTIVSASANDATGSTGALTVQVEGLDADYKTLVQSAIMTGTTAVTFATDFIRVYRAKVLTAGSNGTNVGNIQVKHGSTVLAQITAEQGQTLMSCYTVPDNYSSAQLCGFNVSIDRFTGAATTTAQAALWARPFGGAWLMKDTITLKAGQGLQGFDYTGIGCLQYDPKTDIKLRIMSVSANDSAAIGTFDLVLAP